MDGNKAGDECWYNGERMNCSICNDRYISPGASVIEKHGRKVILQGTIHNVGFHASPYNDYYTVSLYPIKVFVNNGINEEEALIKAELDVSKEYHIPLFDIKKLVRA